MGEYLEYKKKKWVKGFPPPPALRFEGIEERT
jgi:hypothetical protein